MHIGTEYDLDYAYDTYGRFSTITNGGDVFTYGYLANSNLIASVTYPNTITVTNAYELNRNLIDYVENKHGATVISKYDYANDAIGRRTAMAKSGTAFTAGDTVNYTYNGRSELTSADAVTDNNYNFIFAFDNIGNRQSYTSSESGNPVQSIYTTNNLNQYTAITNPTQAPTYDADGDMLSDGTWSFTWNAENRLIAAEKSGAKLEFQYDYAGRRVEKKVYSGSTGNWTLDKHLKFVYDGYEQIEVLDGTNSDAILKKRIWGLSKLICDIHSSTAYYALGDANKNITEYLDSSGNIQAHYEYSPFGKIATKTGTKQNDFDYLFSSEVFDTRTGLMYYNFRYYSLTLGRWLSRDPIEEEGGYNLYGIVNNNIINKYDMYGLKEWKWNMPPNYNPQEIYYILDKSIKYPEYVTDYELTRLKLYRPDLFDQLKNQGVNWNPGAVGLACEVSAVIMWKYGFKGLSTGTAGVGAVFEIIFFKSVYEEIVKHKKDIIIPKGPDENEGSSDVKVDPDWDKKIENQKDLNGWDVYKCNSCKK